MSQWAKNPEFQNEPIQMIVLPEPDDDGKVIVTYKGLERLVKEAGYFPVNGEIRV